VKLYPEIILHALNNNKPVGGVRLWFLAKEFDSGNGHIPSKDFRFWLMDLGVARSTLYRWLDQALELGLITQGDGVYKLVSWGRGAVLVGVTHLSKPVIIDIEKFINKGWLNYVWAGFLKRFENPVSRETLEKMTGTPPRTQLERERKAGVKTKSNYADLGNPKDNPEGALYPDQEKGYYGAHGRIRRRLPNSYKPAGVEAGNVGRTKKANKLINALCDCGAAAENQLERLYCETYQQFKKATRSPRNPQNGRLYLHVWVTHGVELWEGVTV